MTPLSSSLRNSFEKSVIAARQAAENAARASFAMLALDKDDAPPGLPVESVKLRRDLRIRARQLGDSQADAGPTLKPGVPALVEQAAYQHWHRMVFARFLAENNLLIHPEHNVPVSLSECNELAREEGEADGWALAARYAAAILPGIFAPDDPILRLRFPPEHLHKLEGILKDIPALVFTSDDGLGWLYQFWQSRRKDEVYRAQKKISGADIAAVTQLFTEDYMVRFLLENSLGAWWAARHPKSPILKDFAYLRLREDGTPYAGTFPGWPAKSALLKVMDAAGGSGHFLLATFEMLRHMRMEEEGLGEAAAGEAVLRDNLFGLEIDGRCVQIAAFNLALAAWKSGGFRPLPVPNIASCGIPVKGQLETWTKLAKDDVNLMAALTRLHALFRDAPDLGSLIDPARAAAVDKMFAPEVDKVLPLLEKALASEKKDEDPVTAVFGESARGILRSARLLAGDYSLVVTNVPYLTRNKQGEVLKQFCDVHHPRSKADLATAFLERCVAFCKAGGTVAAVTPQNWLLLTSYKRFREDLIRNAQWEAVVKVGTGAFETIGGAVVNVSLIIISHRTAEADHLFVGLDANDVEGPPAKADFIATGQSQLVSQTAQLKNPDTRILFDPVDPGSTMGKYASGDAGIQSGDYARFGRCFWEIPRVGNGWEVQQSTVEETILFGGREHMLFWEDGKGDFFHFVQERLGAENVGWWIRGTEYKGKRGVAVSQMTDLAVTLYTGELFDNNTAVILPKDPKHLPAIWAFCSSPEFAKAVRKIDQKVNVTNATLVKIPFDLAYWQKKADEAGPLPPPRSNDPTQWLFEGNPVGATAHLQVAMGRLLGYRWPGQKPDALNAMADPDGIACLHPVSNEPAAIDKLRNLLAKAYGAGWSPAKQAQLLAEAGFAGKDLTEWLRDGFFEQHCALFHQRPFLWHIWDGRKDGFAAIINYHRLTPANLEKLTYTYLGDWIARQKQAVEVNEPAAEGRLVAAIALQEQLKFIRAGEPPYDIHVRWKALAQQPIGWDPDLNDGVRLNIRPFVTGGILRAKVNINWNKDRGTNPDGSERLNDLHYSNETKRAARKLQI